MKKERSTADLFIWLMAILSLISQMYIVFLLFTIAGIYATFYIEKQK